MCSLGVVQSKGAKAEGSHADKGKKNTTPEELESSIFATGKRRLTIRPRSKALLAMQWQKDGVLTPFRSAKLPKSNEVFHKTEYKPHN